LTSFGPSPHCTFVASHLPVKIQVTVLNGALNLPSFGCYGKSGRLFYSWELEIHFRCVDFVQHIKVGLKGVYIACGVYKILAGVDEKPVSSSGASFFCTEASDWWRSARHEGRLLLSQERLPFYPSRLPLRANFHRERDVRVRDRCEMKSETHFCWNDVRMTRFFASLPPKTSLIEKKIKKSYFQAIQVLTRLFLVCH